MLKFHKEIGAFIPRQRPYHDENTGSRPITEVKHHRAQSVLGRVTTWEHCVPLAFFFFLKKYKFKEKSVFVFSYSG